MALKFFFDTHIAKAVAFQLRNKGIDAVRCEDVQLAEAADETLLEYATQNNRIMVSQDNDFIRLHVQWQQESRQHSGIMFIAKHVQGQAQISYIVQELLFYAEADQVGAVDYEIEIANQLLYV